MNAHQVNAARDLATQLRLASKALDAFVAAGKGEMSHGGWLLPNPSDSPFQDSLLQFASFLDASVSSTPNTATSRYLLEAEDDFIRHLSPVSRQLFDSAFTSGRTPRSYPYRFGVACGIASVIDGEKVFGAYEPGQVEFDAFYAGVDEGKSVAAPAPNTATSRYLPTKAVA